MKVKHTDNGNVKITLSLEQAEALRAGLIFSVGMNIDFLSLMTQEILAHIDAQLMLTEIDPAF